MRFDKYEWTAISIMVSLFILVGFIQGWSGSLVILNMCIISAIMTMGVNISWGYAGVINFGVMGFLAMGGLAAVLVSYPPIKEAWHVGGSGLGISFILLIALVTAVYFITKLVNKKSHTFEKRITPIIAPMPICPRNKSSFLDFRGLFMLCFMQLFISVFMSLIKWS